MPGCGRSTKSETDTPSFVSGSHMLLPGLSQILEHSLQMLGSLCLVSMALHEAEQACVLFSLECLEPALQYPILCDTEVLRPGIVPVDL